MKSQIFFKTINKVIKEIEYMKIFMKNLEENKFLLKNQ